jgi:hypothetical protein
VPQDKMVQTYSDKHKVLIIHYNVPAYNGGDSSIAGETAYGGGSGGYSHNNDDRQHGANGGSGGGASGYIKVAEIHLVVRVLPDKVITVVVLIRVTIRVVVVVQVKRGRVQIPNQKVATVYHPIF